MFLVDLALATMLLQGDPPPQPPPAPQDPAAPATPTAPQETTPATPPPTQRSQELEDLIRRLSQERGAPSLVPPNPLEPALEDREGETSAPFAEKALLTRASDPVQVVLATREQRDLAFWDSRIEISKGDEVRQGPKGCTVLDFPDGASYRFDGMAVYRLTSDAKSSPRLVHVEALGRFAEFQLGRAEIDTVLRLPGGSEVAGRITRLTVFDFDLRALEIRNSGPESAVVRNPYLGSRIVTLAAGQRVFLPVMAEPSAFVAQLSHDVSAFDESRGRLFVQAPDQVGLEVAADGVALSGRGPQVGIARACGARMVVRPGETLKLTRAPLGFPRRREWGE